MKVWKLQGIYLQREKVFVKQVTTCQKGSI